MDQNQNLKPAPNQENSHEETEIVKTEELHFEFDNFTVIYDTINREWLLSVDDESDLIVLEDSEGYQFEDEIEPIGGAKFTIKELENLKKFL